MSDRQTRNKEENKKEIKKKRTLRLMDVARHIPATVTATDRLPCSISWRTFILKSSNLDVNITVTQINT
tara:strand:+ start:436 stop:642 length:207 start_codon:yes stop_codon:yes gene_type:complete